MYEFDSRVRYSETDADGKMTWLALMDYFQDCSVFHSQEVGLGMDVWEETHRVWILSSWQICINRMPQMAEHITTQTWAYGMKGFYGYRNFSMNDAEGRRVAYANSIWVFMDTEKMIPARIPKDMAETYGIEPQLPMACSERKIVLPEKYETKASLVVPSYFIDSNHHMNNSRYVQVALEYVPEKFEVAEVRVEYRKAAMYGDTLIPCVTEEENRVVVALCAEDGQPYAIVVFLKA